MSTARRICGFVLAAGLLVGAGIVGRAQTPPASLPPVLAANAPPATDTAVDDHPGFHVKKDKKPKDLMGYETLQEEALRGVIKAALLRVAPPRSLPGDHHFYISFRTGAPGVSIPPDLSARYPDEMTIVLQYEFWNLMPSDAGFTVTLKFGDQLKVLTIPYDAVTRFYDPSVQYLLKFSPPPPAPGAALSSKSAAPPVAPIPYQALKTPGAASDEHRIFHPKRGGKPNDLMGYETPQQEALSGVIKAALLRGARPRSLPGEHPLYISFRTRAPGVSIPPDLSARYPDEMTIVLQYEFWNLMPSDAGFTVTLKFSDQLKVLTIPYDAVTRFYDPSVQHPLQFSPPPPAPAAAADKKPKDLMGYETLQEEALRGVIKAALLRVAPPRSLPGDHHFYISFRTGAPGVSIPPDLSARYPDEMTIVLQYEFWNLMPSDAGFTVTLKFGDQLKVLTIPYDAVTRFYDPSVQYLLKFSPPPPAPGAALSSKSAAPAADKGGDSGGTEPKIVSPDKSRKNMAR